MSRIGHERGLHLQCEDLYVDIGYVSLNKKREMICGDHFEVVKNGDKQVLVLSDGMGSGIKANILATMTVKMLGTMIAAAIPVREAVSAVAETLPVCSVRQMAYSTFTVLGFEGRRAYLLQYDNPKAVFIRNGNLIDYPLRQMEAGDKEVYESVLEFKDGDMLILMSDGVTNAGMGKLAYGGWGEEDVHRFAKQIYKADMSSQLMAVKIADAAFALSEEETDDDLSVIVLRFGRPRIVNWMIGPPAEVINDKKYVEEFMALEGRHVVTGGTTSKVVARILERDLVTDDSTICTGEDGESVPVAFKIKGIDLVTEGAVTMDRVLEYCADMERNPLEYRDMLKDGHGAALLGKILFDQADKINVFFGSAINTEYGGPKSSLEEKQFRVLSIIKYLEQAGKEIKVVYGNL